MTPFTNHLSRHQAPKPNRYDREDGTRISTYYGDNPRYQYVPYSDCATDSPESQKHWDGSGSWDKRKAWRCPDCGVEADDVTADCCPRCGSCEPLVYR